MPPSLLWLSSLLASFVHFLLSFFSTPLWLAHLCAPSISSLPPPHWSLPADVLCCPLHSTISAFHRGLWKGCRGRREAHRDRPCGIQAAPEKRDTETKGVFCSPFPTDQKNLPHLCHSGDRKGGSGKFSFLVPQKSEPSILNFSL